MKRRTLSILVTAAALAGATGAAVGDIGDVHAQGRARPSLSAIGDYIRAARAHEAILEMDLPGAKSLLDEADPTDAALAIERARYLIYAGDYDGAASLLGRSDLAATAEGSDLGDIARGCARGMAATVEIRDDERGVLLRLQDDDDRALAPMLADVAVQVRAQLVKDLGVELPKPLRIDLVRDQFTLAAMTGLPEEAARTTGTVAVAKWGRVTMIPPRAMSHGYPWLDTLAHEMTHLALSRGTRDRAPLWLQEGVAKREESRWRAPQPFDDTPSPDAVAAVGLEKGLGRPIDKLGPSIAMLPTAEEASVAFAEVSSFINYWIKQNGDQALPQLVVRLKSANKPEDVDKAIQEVSGEGLSGWDKRWRAHLATVSRDLPPDLAPGAKIPHVAEVSKRMRLGQLLDARGHHQAAVLELARAKELVPADASIRSHLAAALLGAKDRASAAVLLEKIDDTHGHFGRYWSLRGLVHGFPTAPPPAVSPAWPAPDAAGSFALGIGLDPLGREVACEEKAAPDLPSDPIRAALCEAARRVPR